MRNKNILVIVQHMYGGGAERVAADLGENLRKSNNVLIVTFDNTHKPSYDYGGCVVCLNLISKHKLMKPFMAVKRAYKLKEIKKAYCIDYSISFLQNANIANVMSKGKEKVVVSIRTNLGATTKCKGRMIEKWICSKADKVVALSNGVRDNLVDILGIKPDKVKAIYNMCDMDRLLNTSVNTVKTIEIAQKMKDRYCLISCGSLRYPKGQWHLIKAFKRIYDEYPNVLLVIFGEGELRGQLEKLADDLGIREALLMPGFIKGYHRLMKKYGKIFCFSSIYEGFGNVLLEAMACDNAVVSTDCDYGPGEILGGKCIGRDNYNVTEFGILTPSFEKEVADFLPNISCEEKVMADAIIFLIENEEVRIKLLEEGKRRVQDFSPQKIINDWSNLLVEL